MVGWFTKSFVYQWKFDTKYTNRLSSFTVCFKREVNPADYCQWGWHNTKAIAM